MWTNYARDRFMFPEMSAFTEANLRDLASQTSVQDRYLNSYVLNSILRGHFDDPKHEQLGFNFQRRAQIAFVEYAVARADTLRYLAALPDVSLSDYATALHHWETTLAALWQGLCLLGRFSDPAAKWYENGDGSKFERLNHMYNRMKHVDKAITAGQVLPDSMTPVWLANDGLKSVDHVLTYEEIAELLTDMEEVATLIQDPVALGQRQQMLKDAAVAAEGATLTEGS